MAIQTAPTKGNLINTKKSFSLAKIGFELMDKKRNILIREMMILLEKANLIQGKIDDAYMEAYIFLQMANITLGYCEELSYTVPVEKRFTLDYKSVMGVEIPIVNLTEEYQGELHYGLYSTNSQLDEARIKFTEVKMMTTKLAEIENSIYRLANAIKKTQKRANALKNVIIPKFESDIKFITSVLEEKEREEFSRLKVIKGRGQKKC